MINIFSLLFFTSLIFASSAEDKTKYTVTDIKPLDGVFIMATGYSTIVIELKKGNFQYWFSSDVIFVGEKKPDFPLKGKFKIKGNTVFLKHNLIRQKEWTFRKINSTVTLWRPQAIRFYQKEKKLDSYGILRFTNRTADKAWNDQSEYFEKSPKTEKYFAPHNDDSKNIKKHPSKVREEELDLIEN